MVPLQMRMKAKVSTIYDHIGRLITVPLIQPSINRSFSEGILKEERLKEQDRQWSQHQHIGGR